LKKYSTNGASNDKRINIKRPVPAAKKFNPSVSFIRLPTQKMGTGGRANPVAKFPREHIKLRMLLLNPRGVRSIALNMWKTFASGTRPTGN
jgi:hypothetical protein